MDPIKMLIVKVLFGIAAGPEIAAHQQVLAIISILEAFQIVTLPPREPYVDREALVREVELARQAELNAQRADSIRERKCLQNLPPPTVAQLKALQRPREPHWAAAARYAITACKVDMQRPEQNNANY